MPQAPEAPELKSWLLENVESLEELEVLAWFSEVTRGTEGDARLIAERAPLPEELIAPALERLATRGFLTRSSANAERFGETTDAAVRADVARIVREYRDNPVLVMKLMTENAIERVRTAALKTFAECFRIRGPGSDG